MGAVAPADTMNPLAVSLLLVVAAFLVSGASSRKILGNRLAHPADWTKEDRLNPSEQVHLQIALEQRNLAALEEAFWAASDPDSPKYQQWWSNEQILALISPSAEDSTAVVQWLEEAGIKEFMMHGDHIDVSASAGLVEALLETELYHFSREGRVIVRQYGEFSVPENLKIDLVLGLSEFPIKKSVQRYGVTAEAGVPVVAPQTVYAMYGVPSTPTPNNSSSQGVIEFEGECFRPKDLSGYASEFGLTLPAITADHIVGNNDPSAPGVESTLDIQAIASTGLGVTNWFWLEGSGVWLYGFATHMFRTNPAPLVGSISYGWNEEQQCQPGIGSQECQQLGVNSKGYVARVNTEFQKIGLKGISLFASSGDSGCNGRTDENCSENHFNPTFPGSSPYLTSVGATEVASPQFNLKNPPRACTSGQWACISSGSERCVSFEQSHFASGGGFSNVSPTPAYQAVAVKNYLSGGSLPPASYYNGTSRGYPDVSSFGSNVMIYESGLEPVGGTSASSPIWAGVAGLMNIESIKKTGKPLGLLNPLLYKMAASSPSTFTDITEGDNRCTELGCSSGCQGFKAAKGWDPVSGLGSPNFPAILSYLNQQV